MSLRLRLLLLLAVVTSLPALGAAWVTRDLLERSLDLGLRAEIDAGLEAGLRRSQAGLADQREDLRRVAQRWLEEGATARTWPDSLTRITRQIGPEVAVIRAGPAELRSPVPSRGPGDIPRRLRVQRSANDEDAGVWVFERSVDGDWSADARAVTLALQRVRSLRAQREQVERAFLMPFLWIYAIALLVSLAGAVLLARGIEEPVRGLLLATQRVGQGDWESRVPIRGPTELRRLGREFNAMVHTLDAQHRRLVELQTLEGWREMARALAHEVKNPLTPIQLTVEEMRQRYRGDDEEYRVLLDECARIVVEEVDSLREVVSRFREFSRPVELRRRPVDLNRLVADVAALQKDLRVECDLDDDVGTMELDPERIRQVLMNLAANARAVTEGRESARLRLRTRARETDCELCVEDDGPGVEPEERERIFEPYRTGRSGGLGLGLALVKGIVLAHGGRIEVRESELGGAAFVLELPREEKAS